MKNQLTAVLFGLGLATSVVAQEGVIGGVEDDSACPARGNCTSCHSQQGVMTEFGDLSDEEVRRSRRAQYQSYLDREEVEVEEQIDMLIEHEPLATWPRRDALAIEARLIPWDGTTIAQVMLRIPGTDEYEQVRMSRDHDLVWRADVSREAKEREAIEYYLAIRHQGSDFFHGSADQPHRVELEVSFFDKPLQVVLSLGVLLVGLAFLISRFKRDDDVLIRADFSEVKKRKEAKAKARAKAWGQRPEVETDHAEPSEAEAPLGVGMVSGAVPHQVPDLAGTDLGLPSVQPAQPMPSAAAGGSGLPPVTPVQELPAAAAAQTGLPPVAPAQPAAAQTGLPPVTPVQPAASTGGLPPVAPAQSVPAAAQQQQQNAPLPGGGGLPPVTPVQPDPRRKKVGSGGAVVLLLGLGLSLLVTPNAQAQPGNLDMLVVATYDRDDVGAGAATADNTNQIRMLRIGGGQPFWFYYEDEEDDAYPRRTMRRSNRALAVTVAPHPTDAGETFMQYLWVTDTHNHRIRRFEMEPHPANPTVRFRLVGGGNATCLQEYGQPGRALDPDDPEFYYPRGIAVHPTTGDLFVTDTVMGRVQVFRPNGDALDALDIDVRVAVRDGANYVMDSITADGNQHGFGRRGDFRDPPHPPINDLNAVAPTDQAGANVGLAELGQGVFQHPHGISLAVDPGLLPTTIDDITWLFIADTHNHRIQIFRDVNGPASFDFDFVRLVGGYGIPTAGDPAEGRFRYPKAVEAVWNTAIGGGELNFWVADTMNGRVQYFSVDAGGDILFVSQWNDGGNMNNVQDIAVSADFDAIYVADPGRANRNDRIRAFNIDGTGGASMGNAILSRDDHMPYSIEYVRTQQFPLP
ncbi:MAG: NHL repeat-containing protein [Acidobacteriota bacterium]